MSARLRVRVQPGARRAGLVGRAADGALAVKVREPARAGKANEAVTALLAEELGLPRRAVEVVRGLASRDKLVEVRGLAEAALEARVREALGKAKGSDA
ncbi:MAG: DUF167 domain-containing protein [Candidatus Eisenbacteria bacterium]|uniref:UPF0235 protein E6K80_08400 n=1 Tax=Eiseniibacteriota bacterium TaxID=2212470 RepID=A0A538U3L4_UNCEI|nr:MAG: DUF167 domain-containing protein [Candidatus Eisenbacteria bacterium]